MSTPMPGLAFYAAMELADVDCIQVPGWLTNNRNSKGPWNDVKFIVVHHTGSDLDPKASYLYAAGLLSDGYQALPGPLCFASPGADGRMYLVGNGRCNHAGGGSPDVLRAVETENYDQTRELSPGSFGNTNGTDGNSLSYGFEVQYSGSHKPNARQLEITVIACAVLCIYHDWSEKSAIGHREWSKDKWDPGQVSMVEFRQMVKAMIAELKANNGRRASSVPKPPVPSIPAPVGKKSRVFTLIKVDGPEPSDRLYAQFPDGSVKWLNGTEASACNKVNSGQVLTSAEWAAYLAMFPKAVA